MISARLAIFDLDDTLLATREAVVRARETVLREHLGLTTVIELVEALEAWQRLTWYYSADDRVGIYSVLCDSYRRPEPTDDEKRVVADRYEEIMVRSFELNIGAEETLDDLKARGILLALVSTGATERQMAKIKHTRLDRWFSDEMVIIDAPGSQRAKPAPTSFVKICETVRVKPSETVTIGDRVTDTIAANLAGCHPVYYHGRGLEVRLPGPLGILSIEMPEVSIRTLHELRKCVIVPGRSRCE